MARRRREEILDAATVLFARRGYRHTTLDAIAGACGLGKTAIYHYFDGKQAIFAAAVERMSRAVIERMEAAAEATPDPVEAIAAVGRARFEVLHQLYLDLQIPSEVIYELGHLALETRQAFFAHEVELLTTLLERAERGGQVRVHSPQEMAEVFSAFFQALERVLAAPHRIEQSLEVLDRVLTFLTLGLIATSEEPT